MRKYLTILIVSTLAMTTSCVTSNKGFQSSPVTSRDVEVDPIKADIVINDKTKLTGTSASTYFLFFRISGDNTFADGISYSTNSNNLPMNPLTMLQTKKLNKIRAYAAYNALSKSDYDLLIHPSYLMTTKNYFGLVKIYSCSVSGYGAKYQNFRTEKK